MRTNKFQSAAKSYTSSNKFIEDYEKLLKKNTGSSLLFAQDTGFNPAYNLTNQPVKNPMLAEGGLSAPQYSSNYEAPARREYAPLPELPEEQGDVLGEWTLPEDPTPGEMLQAIFNATWNPELPSSDELEQRYQETGEAYPVMSNEDGSVTYNDGSVRQMDESPPLPIASMADGTVLWSDGFTREMPAEGLAGYLAGISGLSQFIFGEDQTVTQDYGNYNPELYGGGSHQGVDYRTRDLSSRNLFSPVQMEVVQIITEDTGSPYGNSVLLRLPSGEMLRLSHLSSLGQFTEGSVLNPGDLIGMPGSTGNSTAEHLDVEFYNTDGQLDNPANFAVNAPQYSIANQIVGTSPYQTPQSQTPTPEQPQQVQQVATPMTDAISGAGQVVQETGQAVNDRLNGYVQPVAQVAQNVGKTAEQGINNWNPTGQYGLGISETFGGDPQAARLEQAKTIEKVGQQFNIPEGGVSEATLQGGLVGATRQLAGNLLDTASTPFKKYGLPETGLSEAIAGGKTVNTDINLAPQSFAYSPDGTPVASKAPDYAAVLGQNVKNVVGEAKKAGGNLLSTAAKSVDDYADQVTAQAGQGVSQLKQGVQDIAQNIFKKPQVADVGAKKMVGEDGMQGENQSASSLLDMNKVGQTQDNRDAFFKYGGAETFKDYLAPGIGSGYRGALNFNLFKDSVFDSADAVGNIFGKTYLGEEATGKYKARESAKYPLQSFVPVGYQGLMDYQDGYDRGEIDNYNREVRKSYDDYNTENKRQIDTYNKSVTDYLGSIPKIFDGANWQMGAPKSAKNAFSEASLAYKTPQMSVAPKTTAMSMQVPSISKPQMSMAPKKPQMSKNMMSVAKPQMSMAPKLNAFTAPRPAPKPTPQMSSYSPSRSSTNAPQMSMAPKPTPQMSMAPKKAPQMSIAPKPQPYPIATMRDGGIKYSDGSIRYSSQR